MKYFTYLLIISLSIGSFLIQGCGQAADKPLSTDVINNSKSAVETSEEGRAPNIFFTGIEHDFGKIIQGEKVSYNFKFINTGGSDLLISGVSTSCGCTVGKYPKSPVKSGEHGFIEVKFDSHKRKGIQRKTITVSSNSEPNKTTLRIKAEIVIPEEN